MYQCSKKRFVSSRRVEHARRFRCLDGNVRVCLHVPEAVWMLMLVRIPLALCIVCDWRTLRHCDLRYICASAHLGESRGRTLDRGDARGFGYGNLTAHTARYVPYNIHTNHRCIQSHDIPLWLGWFWGWGLDHLVREWEWEY